MKPRRILIIRPDRIGDVVLTTPLIKAVKDSFPGSFVGVLVHTKVVPLLEHNPSIDVIITDDPDGKDSGRSGFWRQVSALRNYHFDTGLMPLPRERHAWMMLLAGISTRIGVGTKLYQVLTGMKSVASRRYGTNRHEADYVMDLGRKIGLTTNTLIPEIFITDEEKKEAGTILTNFGFNLSQPIIGINPGSNRSCPNWLPDRYAELTDRLRSTYQIVVNLGPTESSMKEYFDRFDDVFIYQSDDLRGLIGLCSRLSILVSSSTGTTHIASALKIPTITLFCTLQACAPERWGPLGNRSIIETPPVDYCQIRCPGNPKICNFEEIPIDGVVHHIHKLVQGG